MKKTQTKEEQQVKKTKAVKKQKNEKKKTSLFKDVKKEMSKVHFPGKKDMIKYSISTICFVIFFGIYFYLIELVMALVKSLI